MHLAARFALWPSVWPAGLVGAAGDAGDGDREDGRFRAVFFYAIGRDGELDRRIVNGVGGFDNGRFPQQSRQKKSCLTRTRRTIVVH